MHLASAVKENVSCLGRRTEVNVGEGGVTAEFGFRRARAGGKGRAPGDDGVCLTTLRARGPGP